MPVSVTVVRSTRPPGERFQVGDVVRLVGDAPEALLQLTAVRYPNVAAEFGSSFLTGSTLVRSLHPLTAWVVGIDNSQAVAHLPVGYQRASMLEFVYRPAPGELVKDAYPVHPRAGASEIANSWRDGEPLVDEEFLVGLHDYLAGSNGASASHWNQWFNGQTLGTCQSETRSCGAGVDEYTVPTIAQLRRGLGMWLLADQGINLCPHCGPGLWQVGGGTCAHVRCGNCSIVALEDCETCSTHDGVPICSQCCECESCSVCTSGNVEHRGRNRCNECRGVGDCCNCPNCENEDCGLTARSCCGQCSDHCSCSSYCIALVNRSLVHHPATRVDRSKLRRLIGAEIEVAGMRRPGDKTQLRGTLAKWSASVVRDGSLGTGGVEIVTSPAAGRQWTDMISEIGVGLKAANAFTNERCGQHVHIDARDLKGLELAKLIQLYAHVEDALFAALPVSRRTSDYCHPCGPKYVGWLKDHKGRFSTHALAVKLYSVYNKVSKTADAKTRHKAEKDLVRQQTTQKYASVRYSALNLHSYWHRGTIEFRHAHGTNRPEQIRNWGIICASIVEAAATFTHKQMDFAAKQGGRGALLYIVDQVSADTAAQVWLQSRWEKFAGFYSADAAGEL